MADGLYYVDSRQPFLSANVPQVTLGTTDKALIPVANMPVLGSNYFSMVGKAVRIRLFGQLSSGTTPGNGTFSLYWGTGADAVGTILVASAAVVLTASMTNSSWRLDLVVRCRAMGTSGSLMANGSMTFLNSATQTTAAVEHMIPSSQPVAVTVDLTTSSFLSPQFKRSGSTAETVTIVDVSYEALN